MRPVKVFVSWTRGRNVQRSDEGHLRELLARLDPLVQNGLIVVWHDRDIVESEDWEEHVLRELGEADLVVALVSAAWLAAPYCRDVERPAFLKAWQERRQAVLPVIIDANGWGTTDLAAIKAAPVDAVPLTAHAAAGRLDQGWQEVFEAVKRIAVGVREAGSVEAWFARPRAPAAAPGDPLSVPSGPEAPAAQQVSEVVDAPREPQSGRFRPVLPAAASAAILALAWTACPEPVADITDALIAEGLAPPSAPLSDLLPGSLVVGERVIASGRTCYPDLTSTRRRLDLPPGPWRVGPTGPELAGQAITIYSLDPALLQDAMSDACVRAVEEAFTRGDEPDLVVQVASTDADPPEVVGLQTRQLEREIAFTP